MDKLDQNLILEAAMTGQLQAVEILVKNGYDINTKHPINQWTPLHWAVSRSNAPVVKFLLSNGADISIKNEKGIRAVDMKLSPAVKSVFDEFGLLNEFHENSHEQADRTNDSFIPNYIINPTMTQELQQIAVGNIAPSSTTSSLFPQQSLTSEASRELANNTSAMTAPSMNSSVPSPLFSGSHDPFISSSEIELIVYVSTKSVKPADDDIIGSVFISTSISINHLRRVIIDELDQVPLDFVLCRWNKHQDVIIPISSKQSEYTVAKIFKNSNDSIVLQKRS